MSEQFESILLHSVRINYCQQASMCHQGDELNSSFMMQRVFDVLQLHEICNLF